MCLLLVSACDVLPANSRTVQEQSSQIKASVAENIESVQLLRQQVDTSSTQISNQIWPLIWMVLVLAGLGAVCAVLLSPARANRRQMIEIKKLLCRERPET